MLTYTSWKLFGFPEDPLDRAQWDADSSESVEDYLNKLRARIHANEMEPILALLQQPGNPPVLTSPYQRFRYWFLIGRAHIICREWDEALAAFATCQQSGLDLTALMQIHLLRSWGYAAQEAHQHDVAFSKYERLADLVQAKLDRGEVNFIQQDAYCFLCNIYRNQAYTRIWVCAPGVARTIMEQNAIPLLDRYQEPFDVPTEDPDAINWRELHIYTLWLLGMAISWQVQLSDDPRQLENDLYDGYESILIAINISRVFPEGQNWLADLNCFAAEMCLMRCELANNRGMQTMLCDMADAHLKRAQHLRHDDLSTKEGRLHALTLDFPYYELTVRKHMIFDITNRMHNVVKDLVALCKEIEGVNDPGYRLLTARCLLLLGTIELELQKFAANDDVHHAMRAQAYLQQGLDFLDRRPQSTLDGLYDREILLKLQQVNDWINGSHMIS